MKYKHTLIIYSASNFITKYICYYLIFELSYRAEHGASTLISLLLLYNILTVILQLAVCYLADRFRVPNPALAGCVLLVAGLMLKSVSGETAVAICGAGSAFVYAAGSADAMVNSDRDGYQLGLYMSLGVFGAAFGCLAGKYGFPYPIVLAMPLFVGISVLLGCKLYSESFSVKPETYRSDYQKKTYAQLIITLAVIFIISYIGLSAVFASGFSFVCTMASAAAVCMGIVAGTYFAHRYGARITVVYSMILALPFLLFYKVIFVFSIGLILLSGAAVSMVRRVREDMKGLPGFALSLISVPISAGVCANCFRISSSVYITLTIVLIFVSSFAMQYILSGESSFISPELKKVFSAVRNVIVKNKEKQ